MSSVFRKRVMQLTVSCQRKENAPNTRSRASQKKANLAVHSRDELQRVSYSVCRESVDSYRSGRKREKWRSMWVDGGSRRNGSDVSTTPESAHLRKAR